MSPPDKERLPASPEEWVIHARSDLTLAQIGRDNSNVLHEQICFYAQQAVEKSLKDVLLFYPGYWEEITEHEVDDAIQLAEKIVTWAGECIKKK